MVYLKAWTPHLKELITNGLPDKLSTYRKSLDELSVADKILVQAWFLNEFWEAYLKKDPLGAPPALLEEVLEVMADYKQLPEKNSPIYMTLNKTLHQAIDEKNDKLLKCIAAKKAQEEKTKAIEVAEKARAAAEEEKRKQKEVLKEQRRQEAQRKEAEKIKEQTRKQTEDEKRLEEKKRLENEQKEKEKQERKEQERKEKEQKERLAQKTKNEEERRTRAEGKKLKEQEEKKKREEELKPLRDARNSLRNDTEWKIDSFVNFIDSYEKILNKKKDFLNGEGEQIKFLLKILSFMDKYVTELEGKTLREVLEIIAERYDGSLKDASEDEDYTFVFKKEVIESEVIPQPAQQPENKQTASNKSRISPEVVAFMQACVSFGKDNLNPYSLSTMFFLSACAYSGGFFLHKVLNDSFAPVPQSFCYSASTVGAFTPYVKDFYKQYQNHLAKKHFENAKKALLATPTWDIELFTNVVDKLLKAKINALDNLTEKNKKIVFLKKALRIYITIQIHTSVQYARDNGFGILKQLEIIYGDLEKASEHDLLLAQDIFSSKKISEKGKRLNNFLMKKDGKISVADELKTAQGFIEKMKEGVGIDVIYGEIYNYAEKTKPSSALKLTQ